MESYASIKDKQPELFECFFAFSNEQFNEGKKKAGIEDKKIYSGVAGLYGTREGIKKLYDDYDAIDKEIAKKCDPQDVYNYEFSNHECSYTNDDEQPINIVVRIFGKERAKEVKRRFAYTEIN
ncbi:MAG: hypothetical protein PHY56_05910 [Candidatus Omnitrophica bacterium]|nr:hypothetical protein [Candidatus Omnitrophota bacterium]